MKEKCATKNCRGEVDIIYLGRPLCDRCFSKTCDEQDMKSMKEERKMKNKKVEKVDVGEVSVKKTAKELLDENAEKKAPKKSEKEKVSPPEVTAEDFIAELKPLGVTTKEDVSGNIGIRIFDKAITYIQRRKYGISYQILKKGNNGAKNWYSGGKITTKAEMTKKVELLKDYAKNKNPETLVKLGFLETVPEKKPEKTVKKPTGKKPKKSAKPKSKKPVKKLAIGDGEVIEKLKSRIEGLGNGSKGIDVSKYPITEAVKSWIGKQGYKLDGDILLIHE